MHRKLPINVLDKIMISFSPDNTPTILLEELLQMKKWNQFRPLSHSWQFRQPDPRAYLLPKVLQKPEGYRESRSQGYFHGIYLEDNGEPLRWEFQGGGVTCPR